MDAGAILVIAVSIAIAVLVVIWMLRSFRGAVGGIGGLLGALGGGGGIKNGVPATAQIQSIGETGMTISAPGVGPEAAVYKLGLQVTPASGIPYDVEISQIVPRIFMPMMLPGAQLGVLVDPADASKVAVDWSRFGSGAAGAGAAIPVGPNTLMTQGGTMSAAGVTVAFDAQGNPLGGLDQMVGAVQSGTMPVVKGKASEILATGTHGTAVVTSCQPLGKKVRDINPAAEAWKLDFPVWLFTVEVSLAGRQPFTSMFGHWVPAQKVAELAPGVKLAVAVDERNPSQDVAIDWDRSPAGLDR